MRDLQWTFLSLIARSIDLLRQYPSLAVPVVVADLLGFTAMHVQHALHQPLFNFFLAEHQSVLSTTHETFRLTVENSPKAALLTFPMLWGCYFLNVCFYAGAMLAVSKFMAAKLRSQPIYLRHVLGGIVARMRDVLVFSLLFIGLLAVGAVVNSLLFMGMINIPWLAHKISFDTGLIIGLVASIPVVYFGTVPALNLMSATVATRYRKR